MRNSFLKTAAALIVAGSVILTAACADSTGPHRDCTGTTSGGQTCVPA